MIDKKINKNMLKQMEGKGVELGCYKTTLERLLAIAFDFFN